MGRPRRALVPSSRRLGCGDCGRRLRITERGLMVSWKSRCAWRGMVTVLLVKPVPRVIPSRSVCMSVHTSFRMSVRMIIARSVIAGRVAII